MARKNKNKISDVQLLQMEKKRLKEVCVAQEEKLKVHAEELRNHSFEMAMHSILPFKTGTQNKIIGGLELLNEIILSPLLGISPGKEKGHRNKNLFKLVQVVLISLSFQFFRKILRKKKSSDQPAAQ